MQPKRGEVTLPGSRLARGLKPTVLTVFIIPKKTAWFLHQAVLGLFRIQLALNLEENLQGELDLTRCGGGLCDSSRSCINSWSQEQSGLRIPKIGSVEEVEELGSKLQVSLFRKAGILDQGEVRLCDTWNSEGALLRIERKMGFPRT